MLHFSQMFFSKSINCDIRRNKNGKKNISGYFFIHANEVLSKMTFENFPADPTPWKAFLYAESIWMKP